MTESESFYNEISESYNATRKADPYICRRLLALLRPAKGKSYMDIGCGTGNYTIALSDSGFTFTGLDQSEKMLTIAKKRAPLLDWVVGSAEKIPTGNALFEGALATLTVHHWKDLEKAFLEINRILKINSRMVLFTSLPEQMQGFWLNHYFPLLLQASIQKMPGLNQIRITSGKAGFHLNSIEPYDVQPELEDHFLYSGKMNPRLYLDNSFRKGISSFAAIDDQEEVKTGLKNLESDIAFGKFENIQKKFENNTGDYIFIVFTKANKV
jgi:ubiquinone/menaquinone biosynthesis C-methylase UbiE